MWKHTRKLTPLFSFSKWKMGVAAFSSASLAAWTINNAQNPWKSFRVLAEESNLRKIDPNLMQKLHSKYYLQTIDSAAEFFKNGQVQILLVNDKPNASLPTEFPDPRLEIPVPGEERAIAKHFSSGNYNVLMTMPSTTMKDLQVEEVDHILKGEFEWAKKPERKGSWVQIFFSTQYYYNDPDLKHKPHLVLLFLNENRALSAEHTKIVETCKKEQIPFVIVPGSQASLPEIREINNLLKKSIVQRFFKMEFGRLFTKGKQEGYKQGHEQGLWEGKVKEQSRLSSELNREYSRGFQEGVRSITDASKGARANQVLDLRKEYDRGYQDGLRAAQIPIPPSPQDGGAGAGYSNNNNR